MTGNKQEDGAGTSPTNDESGAGYGNNPLADEVGKAGEKEDIAPPPSDERSADRKVSETPSPPH